MKKNILFTLLMAFFTVVGTLQLAAQDLPAAFLLGEDEKAYEALCEAHPRTLVGVSNNDMDTALKSWFSLIQEIEVYANASQFKIDGLKVWLHVFWAPDGSIDHIGFFPLPNSRFIKTEELKALFSSFIRHYKPVLRSERPFSHYTSASFPVLLDRK
ncbi:MAG: hypothetical protein ACKOAY_07035 [Haliscomenobacter sp.]